jgi:hypothetical protein
MDIASMNDPQWLAKKEEYKRRLSTIIIPLDIMPGVAKGLLSRIDAFFSEARLELAEIEGQKETVDSIVREWERSKATGSNDTTRKMNATTALQEYPSPDGEPINMYDVQRQLSVRHSYVMGVIDTLHGKQSRLITITGVMKLEKDLSPHGDIGFSAGNR